MDVFQKMFDKLNKATSSISKDIDAKLFTFEKCLLGGPINLEQHFHGNVFQFCKIMSCLLAIREQSTRNVRKTTEIRF
jgi:hypothetical protein